MHSGQTHRWFISSSNVRCRSLLFQLYAWDKPIRFISTYIPLPGTATKWVHSIHDILEKILKSILIIFFSWAFYLPMKQRSSTNSRSAQLSVANSCNFLYALLILLMSLILFYESLSLPYPPTPVNSQFTLFYQVIIPVNGMHCIMSCFIVTSLYLRLLT